MLADAPPAPLLSLSPDAMPDLIDNPAAPLPRPAPAAREAPPDLDAEGLVKRYKGRTVVNGVSIHANCGEIVGILGPNGAGKTTSFYMIVGLVKPDGGKVLFQGENITHQPVYKRARKGLGYLAQEASVFRKLSVEDNVLAILQSLPLSRRERRERCDELLADLRLTHVARQMAYTLSGGERRKLEIARALVRRPTILMLDEPFSGVDPLAVHDIQQIIFGLRDRGLGIIITDHNVRETLSVVDRAYVIFEGRVLCEGTSEYLINDPEAREKYLGKDFRM